MIVIRPMSLNFKKWADDRCGIEKIIEIERNEHFNKVGSVSAFTGKWSLV